MGRHSCPECVGSLEIFLKSVGILVDLGSLLVIEPAVGEHEHDLGQQVRLGPVVTAFQPVVDHVEADGLVDQAVVIGSLGNGGHFEEGPDGLNPRGVGPVVDRVEERPQVLP